MCVIHDNTVQITDIILGFVPEHCPCPMKNVGSLGLSFPSQCHISENEKATLRANYCHLEAMLTILRPPPRPFVTVKTIMRG